jgi:hypothetical protein
VMMVIENLEKMIAQWIAHELSMTIAHTAGNQARVASDAAAGEESQGIHIAAALKQIFVDAKTAAAHAFRSVFEALPFPANAIVAPIAAAAAFAGTMAFAAFEQGGIVPNTGLVMAHRGEMVLPTALSERVQGWTENNSTTNNQGGNVHIHSSPTLHVHSEVDGRRMLEDHADHIGRIAQRQMRTFNR